MRQLHTAASTSSIVGVRLKPLDILVRFCGGEILQKSVVLRQEPNSCGAQVGRQKKITIQLAKIIAPRKSCISAVQPKRYAISAWRGRGRVWRYFRWCLGQWRPC